MIGSGTPSSQSNAPLPKPMVCLPLNVRIGRTTAADVPARPFKKASTGRLERPAFRLVFPQLELAEHRRRTMTDNSPATSFGSQGATHAGDGAKPARARGLWL